MDTHFTQLRPYLTIHQSEIFHTNTGTLKTPEGYVLVDPAFTQADFDRISAFIGKDTILAGFSTHAHYDHLFWSSLFGDETPRYCSEGTLGTRYAQSPRKSWTKHWSWKTTCLIFNSRLLYKHFVFSLVYFFRLALFCKLFL